MATVKCTGVIRRSRLACDQCGRRNSRRNIRRCCICGRRVHRWCFVNHNVDRSGDGRYQVIQIEELIAA